MTPADRRQRNGRDDRFIKLLHLASVLTSTSKQPLPLPPPSSTPNDYCNSLYCNLPKSQITRLQLIQNCLARAVVKAPKFCHITPILHSLHWLKITEHIEYKILSLKYKVLTTAQPSYLHPLITVQPHRSTCLLYTSDAADE